MANFRTVFGQLLSKCSKSVEKALRILRKWRICIQSVEDVFRTNVLGKNKGSLGKCSESSLNVFTNEMLLRRYLENI